MDVLRNVILFLLLPPENVRDPFKHVPRQQLPLVAFSPFMNCYVIKANWEFPWNVAIHGRTFQAWKSELVTEIAFIFKWSFFTFSIEKGPQPKVPLCQESSIDI